MANNHNRRKRRRRGKEAAQSAEAAAAAQQAALVAQEAPSEDEDDEYYDDVESDLEDDAPGEEEDELGGDIYIVAAVHGHKGTGRSRKYLVEWDGYQDKTEWTWEPAEHMDLEQLQPLKDYLRENEDARTGHPGGIRAVSRALGLGGAAAADAAPATGGRGGGRGGRGGTRGGRGGANRSVGVAGSVKFTKQSFSPGTVRPAFTGNEKLTKKNHNLTHKSEPIKFFKLFCPVSPEVRAQWYNKRAKERGIGEKCLKIKNKDGSLKPFVPFKARDVENMDAFFIINSLTPRPSLEDHFSDSWIFAGGPARSLFSRMRFRQINASRVTRDPEAPLAEGDSWGKVRSLLDPFVLRCEKYVDLGRKFSIDEITGGTQAQSAVKQKCGKYKQAGDGFQLDGIADPETGYVWSLEPRANSAFSIDAVYERAADGFEATLSKDDFSKLSPTHQRTLALISRLPHKNYCGGVDNLYSSVRFFELLLKVPQRPLMTGTLRGNKGAPPSLKFPKMSASEVRELRGDDRHAAPPCNSGVADDDSMGCWCILKDNETGNYFFMLSTEVVEVGTMVKKRKVWDKQLGKSKQVDYHRYVVVDVYNNGMGGVDLADLKRWFYQCRTKWMRIPKWTLAFELFLLDLEIVQAHILYKLEWQTAFPALRDIDAKLQKKGMLSLKKFRASDRCTYCDSTHTSVYSLPYYSRLRSLRASLAQCGPSLLRLPLVWQRPLRSRSAWTSCQIRRRFISPARRCLSDGLRDGTTPRSSTLGMRRLTGSSRALASGACTLAPRRRQGSVSHRRTSARHQHATSPFARASAGTLGTGCFVVDFHRIWTCTFRAPDRPNRGSQESQKCLQSKEQL